MTLSLTETQQEHTCAQCEHICSATWANSTSDSKLTTHTDYFNRSKSICETCCGSLCSFRLARSPPYNSCSFKRLLLCVFLNLHVDSLARPKSLRMPALSCGLPLLYKKAPPAGLHLSTFQSTQSARRRGAVLFPTSVATKASALCSTSCTGSWLIGNSSSMR